MEHLNAIIWSCSLCDACKKDDAHAVETNNSQFGLGSGVFTDRERGEKALQLEAEAVL
jgi:hypothetical protein